MEAAEASSPSADGEISPITPFLFGSFFFEALFAKEKAANDLTKTKRLPPKPPSEREVSPIGDGRSSRNNEISGAISHRILPHPTIVGSPLPEGALKCFTVAVEQPIKIQIITE